MKTKIGEFRKSQFNRFETWLKEIGWKVMRGSSNQQDSKDLYLTAEKDDRKVNVLQNGVVEGFNVPVDFLKDFEAWKSRHSTAAALNFQIARSDHGLGLFHGIANGGLIVSDGSAFHGHHTQSGIGHGGEVCFQKGDPCPKPIDQVTLQDLVDTVLSTGVMALDGNSFESRKYMDGSTTTLSICIDGEERIFTALCGDWGPHAQQFNQIMEAFERAFNQAISI